jgi:hypothetical protein
VDHAKLQKQIKTPICLDESIHSVEDARRAIEMGATRIINIKAGRVGGLSSARNIQKLAGEHGIPVWCGGMLESAIGRAHNVHLSTLENFTLPGDVADSKRYFVEEIIEPTVQLRRDGTIAVPDGPGIGYEVRMDRVEKHLVSRRVLKPRNAERSAHGFRFLVLLAGCPEPKAPVSEVPSTETGRASDELRGRAPPRATEAQLLQDLDDRVRARGLACRPGAQFAPTSPPLPPRRRAGDRRFSSGFDEAISPKTPRV